MVQCFVMKKILAGIGHVITVVTDWLLIIAGGLLVFKALVAIDVPAARYLVFGVGFLFMGAGLWYRYRRKRRHR